MDNNKLWFCSDLNLGEANCSELLNCWSDAVFPKDTIFLLGNVAAFNKAYWFNQIQQLPGNKILFLGLMETNRPQWYSKFGFKEVIPFNQSRVLHTQYGKVMLSHLPAYVSVCNPDKYLGLINKFNREFDHSSCVMNIHGFTNGQGNERANTVDVGHTVIGGNIPTLAQLFEKMKDNYHVPTRKQV